MRLGKLPGRTKVELAESRVAGKMLAMKARSNPIRLLLLVLVLASAPVFVSGQVQPPAAAALPSRKSSSASRWAPIGSWPTGTSCTVLPGARQGLEPREAGRARQDERGAAVHRALHLVAGQPREARAVPADQREARRSARPHGGGGAEARRRRQGGHDPELRAALDRGGGVADGGRVRLRLPDPHRRRIDAQSSTTSSTSCCRRSIPTARRWSPTGT